MKRNRLLTVSLASALTLSMLAGCTGGETGGTPSAPVGSKAPAGQQSAAPAPAGKSVELNVVTTFAGDDGNVTNFAEGCATWEQETGHKISDGSAKSDETFKNRILLDFETDSEPDVLFYFNGVDSNPFVEAGKVVSIDEIRAEYPDYATNMKDGMLGASPVDGKNYSVPTNGYWEGLFVNKDVLADCGLDVPGADYTWDQFLTDCQTIKDKGYTPVACSLAGVPHYWFEFTIYNHLTPATHNILPALPTDGAVDTNNVQYQAWVDGIGDIKAMYESGFFPENTLSATDDETFASFVDGKAAFLIDGSWKVGGIEKACGADPDNGVAADQEMLDNFTVTYVPGKGERKATDIIGGLSSGYYITQKAWADPDKRAAAVSFVQHMTSDEMVSKFATATGGLTTALQDGVSVDESQFSTLGLDGLKMLDGTTGIAGAVQDQISQACRVPVFDGMPDLVSGNVPIDQAVQACLTLLAEQ